MLASKKTRRGVIGAVVLAGVLAVSGYALTNAGVVADTSNSADGTGTVQVVTVVDDSIDYTLNATDPSKIDGVSFDVTGASADFLSTTEAWVQLVTSGATPTGGSTAGDWLGGCTLTPGAAASHAASVACTFAATAATPVAVVDVDQFRAVVAD